MKKTFLILIIMTCFFSHAFSSASEKESENVLSLREFCFEIIRARSVTAYEAEDDVMSVSGISYRTVELMLSPVWTRGGLLTIYEYFNPDKTASFEKNFRTEDFKTVQKEKTDWIDSVLYALSKEGEDFDISYGEDILALPDGKDGHALEETEGNDGEDAERQFSASDGSLRHFVYGKENLSKSMLGKYRCVTDEAEGLIRRRIYDENGSIVRYEEFKLFTDTKKAEKTLSREYRYNDSSELVSTEQMTFASEQLVKTFYDDRRNVSERQVSHYEGEKLIPDGIYRYKYDAEGRETEQNIQKWFYSDGKNDSVVVKTLIQKKVYSYTQNSTVPDCEFYENGQLRMKTLYTAENVYNEYMYFDNGFSVEAKYENGTKVSERILLNGREQRRRLFGNE